MTEIAPPKSVGGGGFVFEDKACAWLLASMLAAEPPLEPELGVLDRVEFQVRVDGWLLDDVLLTTVIDATHHRIALSIKSNAQFGTTSAPADFVLAAWQQWLHVDSSVFERATDFLGLITAPVADSTRKALNGLLSKAYGYAGDPTAFARRIKTPRWANQRERDLFESFVCPKKLAKTHPEARQHTAALLQRLRFMEFDFGLPLSESRSIKSAMRVCRVVIRNGSLQDAEQLWNELCAIAAALRPNAGSITRAALVERLRARFDLADHPDHRADWVTLDQVTRANVALVPNSIAGRIPLARNAAVNGVREALTNHDAVAITGRSGVGKSCIGRLVLEAHRAGGHHVLWVDATSFEKSDFNAFQLGLRVRHSLAELMCAVASRQPLLVIDGLDRVFSDAAFRAVATLIRTGFALPPATRWRIAVPCQSQA